MKVKKGEVLEIQHYRKGTFNAIAKEDFDTDTAEWYPVVVPPEGAVGGMGEDWFEGESIPCRASFVAYIAKVPTETPDA